MKDYKLVKKVRTVNESLEGVDVPVCGNCGKPLKPDNRMFKLPSADVPPDNGELPISYLEHRLERYKLVLGIYSYEKWSGAVKDVEYYLHAWNGEFKGHGTKGDSHPHFCSIKCAAGFGCICYRAGYRRKQNATANKNGPETTSA